MAVNKEPRTASAAIVAIAQQRANAILEQARQDAERIKQEAQTAGYDAGYAAGKTTAETEVEQRYQAALRQVQQDTLMQQERLNQWMLEIEPELVDVIAKIASAVIKKQAEVDRGIAVEQVRAALSALGQQAYVRVRVHPMDLPALEEARKTLTTRHIEVNLTGDEEITPGGCVAEGPGAQIDATIEAQVDNLRGILSAS